MRDKRYNSGFTLVELLVSLTMSAVILTAVATFAYAVGTADDASKQKKQQQVQMRFATLRISELIRSSRLICGVTGDDIALWRSDDNGDGQINVSELIYIENVDHGSGIRLVEFSSHTMYEDIVVELGDITSGSLKSWLKDNYDESYTLLVSDCDGVWFLTDLSPPWSRFASIQFRLLADDTNAKYQISAALRSWAGHLLDFSGTMLVSDDDEAGSDWSGGG